MVTAQSGAVRELGELLEEREPDPEIDRMARQITRNLALRRSWRDADVVAGSGRPISVPYHYRSDEIDLDRTLEVLTERPVPEDTDIIVRESVRRSIDVVLMVDVSGSMRGEKVRVAAATVAALSAAMSGPGAGHRLALIGFWSDAAMLEPLTGNTSPVVLLDRLLRIPARGLTNVHFALTVGDSVLKASAARRQVGVLLTDAVHNAGPDPRLRRPPLPRVARPAADRRRARPRPRQGHRPARQGPDRPDPHPPRRRPRPQPRPRPRLTLPPKALRWG